MPSQPEQPSQSEPHGRRLRVTCVIHSLDGGGAERVMAGLASRLAELHTVTLVTLADGSSDKHVVSDRVQRQNLGVLGKNEATNSVWQLPGRILSAADRNRQLRLAIRRSNPDVVLSFCDSMNVRTLLALRGGRFPPVIVVERSDPAHQSLGRLGEWLRRKLYRQAAAVVAQTESQAETLRHMTNRSVDVIPSAVDVPPESMTHPTEDQHPSVQTILSVGRLEREKGFDRLVEAFASIHEKTQNEASSSSLRLRIVGEGSQRKPLEDQIKQLAMEQAVEMPGWVRPIWPEYAAADLFVLPSRYEGFPSALLEAMASGLPSVSVDCDSGPREIIRHGEDGWLAENSVPGLVDAIERISADTGLRHTLSENARQVTQRFGWESLVQRFETVLRRAASPR